jgi:hypothetical protein
MGLDVVFDFNPLTAQDVTPLDAGAERGKSSMCKVEPGTRQTLRDPVREFDQHLCIHRIPRCIPEQAPGDGLHPLRFGEGWCKIRLPLQNAAHARRPRNTLQGTAKVEPQTDHDPALVDGLPGLNQDPGDFFKPNILVG